MTSKEKGTTPLMEQYYKLKAKYPGSILFFRLGDFYEMFNDDAKVAADVLGITLTSRNHGEAENTPLAGVPHHSAESYLAKLLDAGYKVAICEQMEDASQAKGLVKRDIVEVMTPGTLTIETSELGDAANYIVSVFPNGREVSYSAADLMTGEFFTKKVSVYGFKHQIALLEPNEVLLPSEIPEELQDNLLSETREPTITYYEDWKFGFEYSKRILLEHFRTVTLDGFGNLTRDNVRAAGALISYLKELRKGSLRHITSLSTEEDLNYMKLDSATVRNLELTRSIVDGTKKATLLSVLDKTMTAMGTRLLKTWLVNPLLVKEDIIARLNAVEELKDNWDSVSDLRDIIRKVGDLERAAGKLGNQKSNPRDIIGLAQALEHIPDIKDILDTFHADLLAKINIKCEPLDDIKGKIFKVIHPDPSTLLTKGGIIAKGVSEELDELREITSGGKEWLTDLEKELRQEHDLPSLRVGSNKIYGYYIEVSRGQAKKVPDFFEPKQTLVRSERFVIPKLKEYEEKTVVAEERAQSLEKELFIKFREELSTETRRLREVANNIAILDVLTNFAHVATKYRYTKPQVDVSDVIKLKDSRHPVVERLLHEGEFVPNDVYLDTHDEQIWIVTGPNMSGKSTFLRQVALNVLMAQVGSFVPSGAAEIGIVDQIFTRVGAQDNISRGRSTFLVEMVEAANILNNATSNSLVLLDEIGRGTSTFDGLSLAWAITEYLHENSRKNAKTIFATHYHELTELQDYLKRVKNYQVMVKRSSGNIVFLHKIIEGGCDDSYGIEVAKLAGLPKEVLQRADKILEALENDELSSHHKGKIRPKGKAGEQQNFDGLQISLFEPEYHPLLLELKDTDLMNMTPLEALETLKKWKDQWE